MSPAPLPGGTALEYETFGEPADPAILLIAGFGAQMLFWDSDFCEGLARRGRFVIRFDNRDTGLSTKFEHHPVDLHGVSGQVSDTVLAISCWWTRASMMTACCSSLEDVDPVVLERICGQGEVEAAGRPPGGFDDGQARIEVLLALRLIHSDPPSDDDHPDNVATATAPGSGTTYTARVVPVRRSVRQFGTKPMLR